MYVQQRRSQISLQGGLPDQLVFTAESRGALDVFGLKTTDQETDFKNAERRPNKNTEEKTTSDFHSVREKTFLNFIF